MSSAHAARILQLFAKVVVDASDDLDVAGHVDHDCGFAAVEGLNVFIGNDGVVEANSANELDVAARGETNDMNAAARLKAVRQSD